MPKDPYRYFRIEAQELLGRITAGLERIRREPASARASGETMRELRRWAHTLKGAAHVVQHDQIAQRAHRIESLLDELADKDSEPVEALGVTDEIAQLLGSLEISPAMDSATAPAIPAPVAGIVSSADHGMETLNIELDEMDALLRAVNETSLAAAGLRALLPPLERLGDLTSMLRTQFSCESPDRHSQHVDAVADELHNGIGELRRSLDLATEAIERHTGAVRSKVENLRLVEATTVTVAVERTVRSAAQATGKLVEFESSNSDIELDAHLVLAVRDALIQIARNAVAHGIESAKERQAAGKPAAGTVRLEIWREGTRGVFRVSDDGRGIDLELLRSQAVRRGWLTPRQARAASNQELTELLLRPGVTTATAPNQLAGRGIGLDLVSNSVARLKGELRISAEAGKGTTVEIRVPSSISSAALLMVQAGGKSIGIPLDALRRTISLATLPKLAERYLLDGRPLALVSLAQVLKSQTMDSGAGFHPDLPASIALEIEAPPNSFLLGIDRLLSIEQTIIQSLPDHILAEPFVLGASIGPSGEPRLILDPMILAASLDEQMAGPASGADRPAPSLPILVIDDSLTTRMLEQSILETAGYAVELAASAEEGLELARQRRYGLFLVDVEMPGMNGFAFIEKYRQEPALSQIPAILVSSRSSDEDRSRGRDAGAKDYIVKGEFDQRYLLKRVRDLMSAR